MRFTHLAVLATSILVLNSAASAQPVSTKSSSNNTKASSERALDLIARAEAINDMSQFVQAARMFEEAERLLPEGNAEAESALMSAANIYYIRGNSVRAQQLLERAVHHATVRGDHAAAADASSQALFIAFERRQHWDVRRLIDQVVVLAASPGVSDEQRRQILSRVSQPLTLLNKASR